MPQRVDFEVTREAPSLDHYRRGWAPRDGVGLAGIWLGAVVSDASGQDYWGLRGTDDFLVGMTHVVSPICGFRALRKGLDPDSPHLFDEYSSIDWFEPMEYVDGGDRLQTIYSSGRIERDADGFHWYDAGDRWQIHGRPVSDVVVTHVPAQDGVDHEVYYRHELMHATGVVAGVEVSGYAHQDFAYGPPGMAYTELPIARHLQGMWVSWLHEYGDGILGGGSFWQGRDGVAFGPGYRIKDGVTTVHDDIVAMPGFDGDGKLVALDASVGDDSYSFAFDTSGSPLHFFGRLTGDSSGKEPARSWCWVEYAGGMLTPELLDLMMQRFKLARGR
ncbi:hypothetical protein A5660_04130 [Mycobacterium alsense]|uniref:hypothetical protein n=1 Tax=Mycobacterium alsense TaxID=324058 RepID=UPI0007FBA7EF|nr:hypothetical protein [Mycobacterium alsense]OBI98786.1 hypothetical protein A5660_04130 [Mycobacterium alsense]